MIRTITLDLQYQPFIDGPPPSAGNIYQRACEGDESTLKQWRDIWISNYKKNKERFGNLSDYSIGKLYGNGLPPYSPSIVCGSGPSLKHSIEALKENAKMKNPLLVVSCLHNFGYFEDEGIHADFYLTLDAGEIVIEDIYEGRNKKDYWEATKGKKLIAYACSPPRLFEQWQGEVYLFNCLMPDLKFRNDLNEIERFPHYLSTGGNALSACLYFAKIVLRSDVIHFVGTDFCFDFDGRTFHSYASHYDTPGNFVLWPNVYGMLVKTWPSYLAFKFFLDHVACTVPGRYVNCSEGLVGAYREGNIRQFTYMPLHAALIPYQMTERSFLKQIDPLTRLPKEESKEFKLEEIFRDSKYPEDIVMY